MKKIPIILIILISVLIAGCSGSGGKDQTGSSAGSDRSLEKAKKEGTLVLGMDTSELPWVQLNATTGEYEGFEYELMMLIARELGMKLKIISTHWVNLANALLEKKFDILANAYSQKDVEEEENYIFSTPYYKWFWVLCARKDDTSIRSLEDLKGKILGCYIDSQELCKTIEGIGELKVYDEAAYDKLLDREIDAFVYDSTSVYYVVKSEPGLKAVSRIFPEETNDYQLIFRKEDKSLADAVNQALQKVIVSADYKAILAKWIPESQN